MGCIEQTIKELRHSIGDVVEALRDEQLWHDKWQKRVFQEYASGTNESLGALIRQMIDEEIENMAERMCDE